MYVLEYCAEALVLLGFGLGGTNGFTWYAVRHFQALYESAKGDAKTIEVSKGRELVAVAFQRHRHLPTATTSRRGTAKT